MYAKILYFNVHRQERLWLESKEWRSKKTKYEIMSRVRLEECERNMIFMPSKARLEMFLKNVK